ncbi:MAG: DUF4384 domain-containing protein [Labilithrix sp.]|nr:DUF4384 domain-containing protein [Labilithrix sp.]MCW5834927.1 DUF4384 domain-containing protein [Labilithrix sp.]
MSSPRAPRRGAAGRPSRALVLVPASFVVVAAACGPSAEPRTPAALDCDGEARRPLDCQSEFSYDGRKIEGGFSAVGLGGANGKTEEIALRAIDKETEQYAAQSRRLCDEYNKCVIDKATYATRSENLRRRMSKAPELLDEVKSATDEDARRKALAKAYTELVPAEARRELALDFAVEAQKPSDGAPKAIAQGESLPTGTKVAFVVRPSKGAYVYLFQKSPDGRVNVLFPDERIATKNPLAAGATLRLPPGSASFKLNDKDVGTERVYLVASLDPVVSLDGALAKAGGAAAPTGALAEVTRAEDRTSARKGCTRALELDEGAAPSAPCIRSRGLEYASDDGSGPPAAPASFRARTEAADSVIVQVFAFEHTK